MPEELQDETVHPLGEIVSIVLTLLVLSLFGGFGILGLLSIVESVSRTGNYWLLLLVPVVLLVMTLPPAYLARYNGDTNDE